MNRYANAGPSKEQRKADAAEQSAPRFDPQRPFKFTCTVCGGDNITFDAPVKWDAIEQKWIIKGDPYDDATCEDCGGECSTNEVNLEDVQGMTDSELASAINARDDLTVEDKFGDGDQYWVYYLISDGGVRDRSELGYDTWREAAIAGLEAAGS